MTCPYYKGEGQALSIRQRETFSGKSAVSLAKVCPFLVNHNCGVVAGAAVKCGFLWLTAPLVLAAAGLPEKQTAMLSDMFSWPQFVTALCGGLLAWAVLPRVRRR